MQPYSAIIARIETPHAFFRGTQPPNTFLRGISSLNTSFPRRLSPEYSRSRYSIPTYSILRTVFITQTILNCITENLRRKFNNNCRKWNQSLVGKKGLCRSCTTRARWLHSPIFANVQDNRIQPTLHYNRCSISLGVQICGPRTIGPGPLFITTLPHQ